MKLINKILLFISATGLVAGASYGVGKIIKENINDIYGIEYDTTKLSKLKLNTPFKFDFDEKGIVHASSYKVVIGNDDIFTYDEQTQIITPIGVGASTIQIIDEFDTVLFESEIVSSFSDKGVGKEIRRALQVSDSSYISKAELKSIKKLSISSKTISSLNDVLYLTSLETLEISNSKYSSFSNVDFSSLSKLNSLSISSNDFGGNLSLKGFNSLEYLSITDSIYTKAINFDNSDISKIVNADFSNNDLSSLDLTKGTSLRELKVNDNQKLSSLSLPKGNEFTSISASNCALTNSFFNNDFEVKELVLSSNNISGPIDLSNISTIENLDLSNNDITDFTYIEKNVSALEKINLSNNKNINSITMKGNYPKLERIDFDDVLKKLELNGDFSSVFSLNIDFVNLVYLKIDGNFSQLSNLNFSNIQEDALIDIGIEFDSINELSITNSHISSWESLGLKLDNINTVNITDSYIPSLGTLINLNNISLSNVTIKNSEENDTKIASFSLKNNAIVLVSSEVVDWSLLSRDLSKVTSLEINNSTIPSLDEVFTSLTTIKLNNNVKINEDVINHFKFENNTLSLGTSELGASTFSNLEVFGIVLSSISDVEINNASVPTLSYFSSLNSLKIDNSLVNNVTTSLSYKDDSLEIEKATLSNWGDLPIDIFSLTSLEVDNSTIPSIVLSNMQKLSSLVLTNTTIDSVKLDYNEQLVTCKIQGSVDTFELLDEATYSKMETFYYESNYSSSDFNLSGENFPNLSNLSFAPNSSSLSTISLEGTFEKLKELSLGMSASNAISSLVLSGTYKELNKLNISGLKNSSLDYSLEITSPKLNEFYLLDCTLNSFKVDIPYLKSIKLSGSINSISIGSEGNSYSLSTLNLDLVSNLDSLNIKGNYSFTIDATYPSSTLKSVSLIGEFASISILPDSFDCLYLKGSFKDTKSLTIIKDCTNATIENQNLDLLTIVNSSLSLSVRNSTIKEIKFNKVAKEVNLVDSTISSIYINYRSDLTSLSFQGNSTITLLNLANNNLSSLSLDDNNITYLILNNNNFNTLDISSWKVFSIQAIQNGLTEVICNNTNANIAALYLPGEESEGGKKNSLTNVDFAKYLPNLRSLDVVNNNINDILGIKDLVNLEELYLGGNGHFAWNLSSEAIAKMRRLNIGDYQFSGEEASNFAKNYLAKMRSLVWIQMYNVNNFSTLINAISTTNNPNLKYIKITHNGLSEIPTNLTYFTNLKIIIDNEDLNNG